MTYLQIYLLNRALHLDKSFLPIRICSDSLALIDAGCYFQLGTYYSMSKIHLCENNITLSCIDVSNVFS